MILNSHLCSCLLDPDSFKLCRHTFLDVPHTQMNRLFLSSSLSMLNPSYKPHVHYISLSPCCRQDSQKRGKYTSQVQNPIKVNVWHSSAQVLGTPQKQDHQFYICICPTRIERWMEWSTKIWRHRRQSLSDILLIWWHGQ